MFAFVRNINSGTDNPQSRWYQLGKLDQNLFKSTLGLVGFAAFLQIIAWLTIALVQYEVPGVVGFKHTPLVLKVSVRSAGGALGGRGA